MSTITIRYNSKCFWIEDLFIEVLSHFICQSFESISLNNFNSALTNIYDDCDMNRKYPSKDMNNILLDEYITNSTDIQTLNNVLEQSKTLISVFGNEISFSQLNSLEATKPDVFFRSNWTKSIKTNSLIATINLIQQLLNGTFLNNNAGYHYEGFDGARPNEIII